MIDVCAFFEVIILINALASLEPPQVVPLSL